MDKKLSTIFILLCIAIIGTSAVAYFYSFGLNQTKMPLVFFGSSGPVEHSISPQEKEASAGAVKENGPKTEAQPIWPSNVEKLGQARIIIRDLSNQEDLNESIQNVLKEVGLQDKRYEVKSLQEQPSHIILLYADEMITNLKAHNINQDKIAEYDYDISKYHEAYGINDYQLLKDKFNTGEVLMITCNLPEGIPYNYLVWDNMPYGEELWIVQYDG